jgi:eukaryotic-like serine/threonine-protein kinase
VSDNINQDIAISGERNIVVGKGDVIINPLPPAEARLRHDLGILLKNVETTWIKGVLEKSVYGAALLELGMELREETIDNPWRMILEGPNQTRQILPRGRKIKDIFDEANRLLLILGKPGSGKTTTLLQLARDLIAEVDSTFTQPVPVILNLSTWTNKQQPLDDWLVAELNSKYRLPKKDGQLWLKERRVLPLLDGLDEVKLENRAACVVKINQLVTDYGLQGLVVCSRIKDYTDLNVRLAFYRAIYLQPLTPEQVDEYLDQAGDKLASLRRTLQADKDLQSMAQSPLILSIMSLAYQNTSAKDLSDPSFNTNEARRQHLFDTYIARMFNRKVGARPYSDEQTKQYLSWLARNMQRQNQEVFLKESLQPSWLHARHWEWIYILASRIISGLIFGLNGSPVESLTKLENGLITGLIVGFIDALRFEWFRQRKGMKTYSLFWWSVINVIVITLIVDLIYGLALSHEEDLMLGLFSGNTPGHALFVGIIFGLRGSQQTLESDIQTAEALHWSWRKVFSTGLFVGLGVWLVYGLISWLILELSDPLTAGLGSGLLFGLISAVIVGLSREIIETKTLANQGIRLLVRNAIFGMLIIGLVSGPVRQLIFWLIDVAFDAIGPLRTEGLIRHAITSTSFGLLGGLWFGGLDVIQHYVLRLILVIQGHTPANYARFLDYAVDRIFLQKVGGGYRFIHRLLLEHFADMSETRMRV